MTLQAQITEDYVRATKVKQETTTWHLLADVKRQLDL